jgi:hypothetical protein
MFRSVHRSVLIVIVNMVDAGAVIMLGLVGSRVGVRVALALMVSVVTAVAVGVCVVVCGIVRMVVRVLRGADAMLEAG